MKLIFPNHEHGDVMLGERVTRIGAAAGNDVRLEYDGVADIHAEIGSRDGRHVVRVLTDTQATVLNGRQVNGEAVLRPGDLLLFGRIGCRVGTARQVPSPSPVATPAKADGDGAPPTLMRAQLPQYVLRGQGGVVAGKSLRVLGSMTMGRAPDCDLVIRDDGVSRKHARLRVTEHGLSVEDLGSANGTFIDGERISTGLLVSGQELRLDEVRFVLSAPPRPTAAREPEVLPRRHLPWLTVAVVILAAVVGWFFLSAW